MRVSDALDTASVYLTLAGLGCRVGGKARLGGALLLLSAYGYLGLLHERIAQARISGYRHGSYRHLEPGQILLHAALGLYGYELLTR